MKTVNIQLKQESTSIITTAFEIDQDAKINNDKLTQTITKAVFKRYQSQLDGIRTGLKVSKPFYFSITIDNQLVIDTNQLSISAGMQGRTKINLHTFKKNPADAKAMFNRTLLYILEASQEFSEDLQTIFE